MSKSTLTKFGVPVNGTAAMLHPKQKYRFRVLFENFGANGTNTIDITQNVDSVGRPKLTQPEQEVHAYNSTAYIAGKHKWEPIEVKVRDDITNAVVALIGEQVQRQVNHYEQTSATSGSDYKFNMRIESLDGSTEGVLEHWYIEGCFITGYAIDGGDYKESGVQQVTLNIRYDNATHQSDFTDPPMPEDGPGFGGSGIFN